MLESGKRFVLSNLLYQFEHFLQLGYTNTTEIEVFILNDELKKLSLNAESGYKIEQDEFHHSLNISPLQDLNLNVNDKIALLSDCSWNRTAKDALLNWSTELPSDSLRIIKIGDEPANLKVFDSTVYPVEDFFCAIDGWL
jgi:hypothetical protein